MDENGAPVGVKQSKEGGGGHWWACSGRSVDLPELSPCDVLAASAESAAHDYAELCGDLFEVDQRSARIVVTVLRRDGDDDRVDFECLVERGAFRVSTLAMMVPGGPVVSGGDDVSEADDLDIEPGEAWDLADGMRALSMLAAEMKRRGDPRRYGINCAWWMLEKLSKTDDMTEALDELKAWLYGVPTGPAPAPCHAEPGDRS